MNYTSKTEDEVCRQYPSLCASAGITFSIPDKRLQLNIACHDLFRKEYSDWESQVLQHQQQTKEQCGLALLFYLLEIQYLQNAT